MKKKISPFGKTLLFGVPALIGSIALFTANSAPEINEETGEEIHNPEAGWSQDSEDIVLKRWGNEYRFYQGMVISLFDSHNFTRTNELNHIAYNFNLGTVTIVDEDGSTTKTFAELAESGPEALRHIERVRAVGCEIAATFNTRAATNDYEETPDDVMAFYEWHCPKIGDQANPAVPAP